MGTIRKECMSSLISNNINKNKENRKKLATANKILKKSSLGFLKVKILILFLLFNIYQK